MTSFFGGAHGDPAMYAWLLRTNSENVLTYPSSGFDAGFLYPYGNTLAFSDNYLLPSLLAKPFLAIGCPLPMVYNSLFLLAATLNGYTTNRLARFFGTGPSASFFAGAVFMLFPFFREHSMHPQLQYAFFLPLTLLALLQFFKTASLASASLVGFSLVSAFLCAVYYSMFSLLLLASTALAYSTAKPSVFSRKNIKTLLLANLPNAVLLIFVTKPYRETQSALGQRSVSELAYFQATIWSYLAAPESNALYGKLTSAWSHSEARLFPGTIVLLLAAYAFLRSQAADDCSCSTLVFTRKSYLQLIVNRPALWVLPLLALLLLCSLAVPHANYHNSAITIFSWLILITLWVSLFISRKLSSAIDHKFSGNLSQSQIILLLCFVASAFFFASLGPIEQNSRVASLGMLLYDYVPGIGSLRAVGRFGIVTVLCLSLLAGMGLEYLMRAPKYLGSFLLPGLAILILPFELYSGPLTRERRSPLSEIADTLALLPGHEAVIALPLTYLPEDPLRFAKFQTHAMQLVEPSKRPLVNGLSGIIPPFYRALHNHLIHFPDKKSLAVLSAILGLRYIVYFTNHKPDFDRPAFEKSLISLQPELRVLTHDKHGAYLLELNPIRSLDNAVLVIPPDAARRRRLVVDLKYSKSTADDVHAQPAPPLHLSAQRQIAQSAPDRDFISQQIDRTTDPRRLTVVLPPSSQAVKPEKIRLRVRGLQRGEKLSATNLRIE